MLKANQIAAYKTNGFLVLKRVLGDEHIKNLQNAFLEIQNLARDMKEDTFRDVAFFNLHRPLNPFDRREKELPVTPGVLRRVTYPYAINPVINSYRTCQEILDIARSLLGDDIVQIVNQANFNPPKIGTGWGWHQDYRFRREGLRDAKTNFIQCLLALDPCNEKTGGLRIIPGSDHMENLKLEQDQEAAAKIASLHLPLTPRLDPGDLIIFSPYMIHGSTPNASEQMRRVFINGYANANACDYGMTVMKAGAIQQEIAGSMEYEHNRDLLPLAAKY
jgi:ectoine hydroxylase-related dioxygenase (phytanoyl-CoA dioxygenase family)